MVGPPILCWFSGPIYLRYDIRSYDAVVLFIGNSLLGNNLHFT